MTALAEATIVEARIGLRSWARCVVEAQVAALAETSETRAIRDDIVSLFAAQLLEVPGPVGVAEADRAHNIARRLVMMRPAYRIPWLGALFDEAGIT